MLRYFDMNNAAHLHVRWYGISDDAWVRITVDDADGRYVFGGTFSDCTEVLGRVEEDGEVGEVCLVLHWCDAEAKRVSTGVRTKTVQALPPASRR